MELRVPVFFTFLLLVCRIGAQNFEFAFRLYKAVADQIPSQNVVMSPLSVATALGLLMLGAGESTQQEIWSALGCSQHNPCDKTFFKHTNYNYQIGNSMILANKVYTKAQYVFQPQFEAEARRIFSAETQSINFADSARASNEINSWVEQKTGGKITNLFQPGQFNAATRLVLVNAMYFKGLWKQPFNIRATQKRPFWLGETRSVMVDMMYSHMDIDFADISDLDAQVGRIPYQNSDLSMMIFLPHKKTGLAQLEEKLKSYVFSNIASLLRPRTVDVSLPKFTLQSTIDVKSILKKLGIVDLFSQNANLSKILQTKERLTVDTAVHKATVEVNEEGTVAAAATGFGIIALSASPTLVADHPFLFAIVGPDTVPLIGSIRVA